MSDAPETGLDARWQNAEQIAAYQVVMDGGPIAVRVASGDPDSIARGESLRKYAARNIAPAPATATHAMPASALNH